MSTRFFDQIVPRMTCRWHPLQSMGACLLSGDTVRATSRFGTTDVTPGMITLSAFPEARQARPNGASNYFSAPLTN